MLKEQRSQTVMLDVACETIDPTKIAEIVTLAGYNVKSVECERGGTWVKPEKTS